MTLPAGHVTIFVPLPLALHAVAKSGDVDGEGVRLRRLESVHCTRSAKLVAEPQLPPVGAVSCDPGRMVHELRPRQDVLTMLPLAGSGPAQEPLAKGPAGQAPVGLP